VIPVGWGMGLSHAKLVTGPNGRGSGQGRDAAGPEGFGSQWGMALVIPLRPGAGQGLRNWEPEGLGSWQDVDLVQSGAHIPRGRDLSGEWI
jgi:hypothetical protein